MTRKLINYNQEELDFIQSNSILPRRETYNLFQKKFTRPDVNQANLTALCKRNKWFTGRTGRFDKGHDGYKGGPGGPNRTSFKKGGVPANRKPLYSERISKLGYVEIKIAEKNPYTGADTRYRLKHQWVWEQRNGPVAKGFILHFKDGDRQNCDIGNLEVFERGVGAILNKKKHGALPEEIKPVVKTLAKLQYKTGQLVKAGLK